MFPLRRTALALTLILIALAVAGCGERDVTSLEGARARVEPPVFGDDFSDDVYPQPFYQTYYEAVRPDSIHAVEGVASMKVVVAPQGSPLGPYSGGVLTSVAPRDFTDFNALTFWARSDVTMTLDTAGFGNDNTGFSSYECGRNGLMLSTAWTKFVIPIPNPSKLISERGLFTYAEGPEIPEGQSIWFDEIRFETVDVATNPRPRMPYVWGGKDYFVGSMADMGGTVTYYDIGDQANVRIEHMPGYFDFTSSDPSVAEVGADGIRVVGPGSAVITGVLGDIEAAGNVTINAHEPPTSAAPAPVHDAADVITMFSDVYGDNGDVNWNPGWGGSTAELSDYAVEGDNTLMYASLNWVGVDFAASTIDVTGMTHLHLDVYASTGSDFRVKIINLDGDGGVVVEQIELTFDETTTPAFTAGGWSSLDIPLESFGFTGDLLHVGQMAFGTSDARLVLVDNVYWHR